MDRRLIPRYFPAVVLTAALSAGGAGVSARPALAQEQAAKPLVGTVSAIQGDTITVKADSGTESVVTVPSGIKMVRTAPGQKTLAGASPIQFGDLQLGDRVLLKAVTGADGKLSAATLIAMKKDDIAQKHAADREDWQKRGTGGVVKSVDGSAGDIVVSLGSAGKTMTVHTTKATVVRRYAPESVKYDDARPSSVEQIKAGDQLRVRGEKNADGSEVAAEEIVAGTFHNVAGTVISVDAAAKKLTVTDLATKKPVVIQCTPESQLRKLPEAMARGIAMRLKAGANGAGGAAPGGQPGARGDAGAKPADAAAVSGPTGGPGAEKAQEGSTENGRGGAHPSGDLQQVLSRAPSMQLGELKKGDAVMVVTTEGTSVGEGTAVTLLAGVEALLEASPGAGQSVMNASWNLGGGGGGEATE